MSDLVDRDKIESIVGVQRHPTFHIGTVKSEEDRMYVLHSKTCVSDLDDLRMCKFSKALDKGLNDKLWSKYEDQIVLLGVMQDILIPAATLNSDMECEGF